VLRRRRQHAPQQLAVAGLNLGPFAQRHSSPSDPLGEFIANLLELLEAGDTRLGEMSRDPGVEIKPRKSLNGEARKLMLETADLAAQLSPREALIASHAKLSKRVSIEQIRH
jgi:hypothetical protein